MKDNNQQPSLRDAVTAPSGDVLARLTDKPGARRFDNFYPPDREAAHPTTDAAIDDFLATYGSRSPEEDMLLERLIFNPVPDYSEQLAREAGAPLPPPPPSGADSRQARIDRFILADSTPQPPAAPVAKEEEESQPHPASASATPPASATAAGAPATAAQGRPALSESLARIYIKTRRYERAYEILNDLSLRFPEKSAYFADQLRFLQKLIVNERHLRRQSAL